MIQLKSTDSLQVLLAGAITTSQGVLYATFADIADDGSTFAPSPSSGATNSTTAVDWVAAPAGANDVRVVKYLSLYNADTAAMTATVRVVDNGANRILGKFTLAAGERLEYADGFQVAAAGGGVSSVNGLSGAVTLGGESIAEPVNVLTPSSGVVNIDCALGDYFTLAPTANVTSITYSNLPAAGKAQTIMVHFTQDTTPRTVAWPASAVWEGGAAGAVSTGSGAVDAIAMTTFDQGTTWLFTIAKAFA